MSQAQPQALFDYAKYWAECYGFTDATPFCLALAIYRSTI